MFYTDDAQKTLFSEAIERAAEMWDGRIVTELAPLGEFYRAEEYHQDFFAKNPDQGYCLAVALPKVNKVRKSYAQYVKAA
jgi:peptide-methionine (S)-S-oxide reductase